MTTPRKKLLRTFLIPLSLALVAGVIAYVEGDWPLYSLFVVLCYLLGLQLQRNAQLLRTKQEQETTIREARRQHDEEQLRTTLLSSVSHDLKTPLVTMMGAATSLRDLHSDLNARDRVELLDSIISESQRLESYIQNLLDMTRLGHGTLSLSRSWVSVSEIYNVVLKRIERQFPHQIISFEQQENLPPLHVHAALIEQGLYNGIENACKAVAGVGNILVSAKVMTALPANESTASPSPMISICVFDQGPGLPPREWEKVFDRFYSFNQGDRYEKGTGLGLSICRSIFRVHGGEAKIIPAPPGYHHCLELSLRALDTTRVMDMPPDYYV